MKRLYYLTDKIEFAEHISQELTSNGIDAHHIHVLSKNEAGVVTHHLHGPNLFERNDFLRRALIGMVTGLIVAIVAMFIAKYLLGYSFTGLAQFALLLLIMLFGTWLGGFIGFATENKHLKRFHDEIEKGRHLIMIDVKANEERLVHKIVEHLNEADFSGEDKHVLI
ncbi:hypothetical protein KO489_01915 [Reinekea forsetii]|nr:hypothetical protein [Reinekea forsetii]